MLLCNSSRVYVSLNRDSTFMPLSNLSGASHSSVYKHRDDLFVSFRKFQSPSAERIYRYYFQTKMSVNLIMVSVIITFKLYTPMVLMNIMCCTRMTI